MSHAFADAESRCRCHWRLRADSVCPVLAPPNSSHGAGGPLLMRLQAQHHWRSSNCYEGVGAGRCSCTLRAQRALSSRFTVRKTCRRRASVIGHRNQGNELPAFAPALRCKEQPSHRKNAAMLRPESIVTVEPVEVLMWRVAVVVPVVAPGRPALRSSSMP